MITEIKWNNHPVLGNLKLELTKADGTPYNTIVIAGENGTGKTTILETLSKFLNLGSMAGFEYIKYRIDDVVYKIVPIGDPTFGFHKRINENNNLTQQINSNKNNNRSSIENDKLDIRHYGFAYSKARSGFKTNPVRSSTTQQLDDNKYIEDNNDDFTTIKQLLVDIKTQDNSLLAKKFERHEISTPEQYAEISKIKRFKTAFDNFFVNMTFEGIDDESLDEKKIVFSKYSNTITIDQLSTGEKQIVFRGAYLLKNSNNLDGGVVLIDEPELSMHPKWQEKIFKYYRGLFTSGTSQTTQMFFATHSEYVIRSAIEDKDNVLLVILSNNSGNVTMKNAAERVLPTLSSSEVNYLAFDIKSVDYHIALYSDLQVKTGLSKIKDIDDYISNQTAYFSSPIHEKIDNTAFGNFKTLPTYIRNAIDHPDSGRIYSESEFSNSIELLRILCKNFNATP